MNKIRDKLEEFDIKGVNEKQIKNYFFKLHINNENTFVSKTPSKLKLLLPIEIYNNHKNIVGVHPFDSNEPEILKTHNKHNKKIYHFMDVGGYSNMPCDSTAIKLYNTTYNQLMNMFTGHPMYEALLKRYSKVVGTESPVQVVIHKIKDTVLYINNSIMSTTFPDAYLDGKTLFLFKTQDKDERFKLSHRTTGKKLFPNKVKQSNLYSNIYPGRFGNNSININNVNEINTKGQKFVRKCIKHSIKPKKKEKRRNYIIHENNVDPLVYPTRLTHAQLH